MRRRGADHTHVTSGDFDFFGVPTSPPPAGPPAGSQFGTPPATSQFGTPATSQFGTPPVSQLGTPATVPLRPSPASTGPGGGRQLGMLAGVVAVIVLAVGGFLWLQTQGKKTATKVADTVETPIVKAHQTEEILDLQQASQAEETYLADHSAYATSISQLTGFVASPTSKITVVSATATTYCLRADDTSTFHAPTMYVSSASGGASTTPCS
ncbi:MAG: hypothetical protein QOE76_4262 [Frankiales bacterium]|jgi:hypothetical protein|nr:hypothetical protein [Frankiales bacterium]